jgi:hypothetical protein
MGPKYTDKAAWVIIAKVCSAMTGKKLVGKPSYPFIFARFVLCRIDLTCTIYHRRSSTAPPRGSDKGFFQKHRERHAFNLKASIWVYLLY